MRLLLTLVLLLGGLAAARAPADPPPAEPRLTLLLKDEPLTGALAALFRQAGREYRLEAPDAAGSVTVSIRDVPFEAALRAVLRQAKPPLSFRTEGQTTIISAAAPAPAASGPAADARYRQQVEELRALAKQCYLGLEWPPAGSTLEFPRATSRTQPLIRATAPTEEDLRFFVPLLLDELRLYPVEVLRRASVSIVLGHRVESLVSEHRSTGMQAGGAIGLNISRRFPMSVLNTLHHELMHTFDRPPLGKQLSTQWAVLNPPGFQYSDAYEYAPARRFFRNPVAGFLSAYSMWNEREDRAEVFGGMMTDCAYVDQVTQRDPLVAAKVACLKRYFKEMSPEMDDRFWQKVRARYDRWQGQ